VSFELLNKDGRPFRPYQHMSVRHLTETPKCGLFAFMGAGKTASVLTAISNMIFAEILTKPTLVVAPLRVARDVWPNEPKEWPHLQHLRVMPMLGTPTQRQDAFRVPADIYTINFENLEWLIKTWGPHWPYGMVVVDESTKLKSLRANIRENAQGTKWVQGDGGKRAKALLKATYEFKTDRFVELSGTPAPNGLQDLWGQLFFLDHGKRLGRVFDAFQTRWFRYAFDGFGIEPLPHAQEQIQSAIKDICLSLKSEDWFELEKPIVRTIEVTLPPTARAQYREMERQMFTEIQEKPIEAFNAGARTQKLLQMAAGACYTGHGDDPGPRQWVESHPAKLDALEEIVEEAAGEPLLVAYHFKSDLSRLTKRFPKGRHLDQKSQTIKDWNDGKIPLLFTHPASAGHGLNLQHGGSRLVYFSSSWNFEEHSQILERIGPVRQAQSGYKRNVFVYHIIAKNTVDEDVQDALSSKRSVQDVLMDGLKRRLFP
jgi:SNF2 family DNA or RNA helicase